MMGLESQKNIFLRSGIVSIHNGDIRVKSKEGVGTSFIFQFPKG